MIERETRGEWPDRMRAGLSAAVAKAGAGLRVASAPALVGLLSAGALAPVALAVFAAGGPIAAAGLGVVGSVGANVLTQVIAEAIEKLKRDAGSAGQVPDPADLEQAIADRVESVFTDLEVATAGVRAEIAEMLDGIGAVPVALDAAAANGDRSLEAALATAFGVLSLDFQEFGFVLADVQRTLWQIDAQMRLDAAERRSRREQERDDALALRLSLDKLLSAGGPGARDSSSADGWHGCPYRGLESFEQQHAGIFHGRRRLTALLVQRLAERLDDPGLFLMVGASGVGKSSLLRAGLLAQLGADRLAEGCSTWPRRVLTPTGSPLRELAVHLADLCGGDSASMFRSLSDDPAQASLLFRQVLTASGSNARVVLVIDQFEELFTLVDDQDPGAVAQRAAYVTALSAAAEPMPGGGPPAALVVLSIRGDFLDRAMAFPPLRAAVDRGVFTVGAMTESELGLAITAPAAEAGISVESGLPKLILDELRAKSSVAEFDVGALPLLSQAMFNTWEHRENGVLTVRAYRRVGGVADSVQSSAEAAYAGLTTSQRETARRLLTHLTTVTGNGEIARRRSTRSEIGAACSDAGDVEFVLEVFADRRLITLRADSVEIAHEVLLLAWSRLRGWLDDDHVGRALYGNLLDDAAAWQAHGRDPSFLYRGTQLVAVEELAGRWSGEPDRYPAVAGAAAQFLDASRRTTRVATYLRRSVAAGMVALTAAAVTAAVIAADNADTARRQRDLALSRQLATQSHALETTEPVTARRLAAAAWHFAHTDEARGALSSVLSRQRGVGFFPNPVTSLAFSPNGVLAVGSGDTVRFRDPVTGESVGAPIVGHTGAVTALAFSPDGQRLATGGEDHQVRLWQVPTGKPVAPAMAGHHAKVTSLAFSPDGHRLASASLDSTARLWTTADGGLVGDPLVEHRGAVYGVAFSPDNRLLATASLDTTARLWDAATARPVGDPLRGHDKAVSAVAFRAGGREVLTVGRDGNLISHDTVTRKRATPVREMVNSMTATVFSPDTTRIAAAARDEIRLGDLTGATGSALRLRGHVDTVRAIAFSPHGGLVATAGDDRTVRLWDARNTGRAIGAPLFDHPVSTDGFGRDDRIGQLAFSPDGERLAAADDDMMYLWNPRTGATERRIPYDGGPAEQLSFSRDSRRIFTTSRFPEVRTLTIDPGGQSRFGSALDLAADGTWLVGVEGNHALQAYDGTTSQPIGRRIPLAVPADPWVWPTYQRGGVRSVTVGPAGKQVLVESRPAGKVTAQLWSTTTGAPVGRPLAEGSETMSVRRFSPDGRLFAAVLEPQHDADDAVVRVWDTATGARLGDALRARSDSVLALSFNPDGRLLAIGSDDHSVRFWDTSAGAPVGVPFTGHSRVVRAIAFSPDGRLMASSDGYRLLLWATAQFRDPLAAICAQDGNVGEREWHAHAPGEPLPQVCR